MRIRLLAAAAVVLALAGCTTTPVAPAPAPTAPVTTPQAVIDPTLVPADLGGATAETAAAEGARLADAIQALINPASILSVTDSSQLVPSEDDIPGFYGVHRSISVDPSVDPQVLAQTMATVMAQSSWTIESETSEDGVYLAAISYGPQSNFWFAFVSGDASKPDQPVIVVQIASPDLLE